MICLKIMYTSMKLITIMELRFLMMGGTAVKATKPNPLSNCLSE